LVRAIAIAIAIAVAIADAVRVVYEVFDLRTVEVIPHVFAKLFV
jgi:hypothetical protein